MKHLLMAVLSLLATIFIALSPAQAQQATKAASAEKLPSAQEVIERYEQAVGGKTAWEKLHSRVRKGTIELTETGLKGTVELKELAPDKFLLVAEVPGLGEISRGFDGTTAWAQDPQSGARIMTGNELADTQREAQFYMPLRLMELYPKMNVTGKQKLEGRDVYEVQASTAEGASRTFDFDAKSGYLVRLAGEEASEDGKYQVELFLEDYKDFNGVMLPTIHRQTNPLALVMHFTDVQQNVTVPDSVFSAPKREPGPQPE
jgi:outer membrane lipoprotein-sorting protein